jgi:hypothetical protein
MVICMHSQQQPFQRPQPQQGPFSNNQTTRTNQPIDGNQPGHSMKQPGSVTPPSAAQDTDVPRRYQHIDVFGNAFAFQFKRSSTKKKGWETLLLEAAGRTNPSNPQDKTFNWAKGTKITLQLTFDELPLFIAVLYGFAPSVKFDSHGPANNKGFSIEFQNDKFFVNMFEKGKTVHYAPVPLINAMHIGNLALAQYAQNFDGVDSDTLLQNIHRYTQLLRQSNNFPLNKK